MTIIRGFYEVREFSSEDGRCINYEQFTDYNLALTTYKVMAKKGLLVELVDCADYTDNYYDERILESTFGPY